MTLILTSSSYLVTQDFLQYLPDSPTNLKLTFIPTAAEVETGEKSWLERDKQALIKAGFKFSEFSFTGKKKKQVEQMLKRTDVLFISGGNTFYLLQEMKKSGFAELIHQYKDLIYIGSSAGSLVAGPDISLAQNLEDTSLAPDLEAYSALNLTDVIVLPHWGVPHFAADYEKVMKKAYQTQHKIILLRENQYVVSKDNKLQIISILD